MSVRLNAREEKFGGIGGAVEKGNKDFTKALPMKITREHIHKK